MTTSFPIAVIDENNVFHGVVDRGAILAEVTIGIDDDAAPTRLSELNGQDDDAEKREDA